MINKPKVTIVLPVFNGERFIADCINSIQMQTYTNWELIIVNDCSTDNTYNIIKSYEKNDNRIRIINNKINSKLPKSLNIGFSCATGEYYTWTSDDNIYKQKAIEYMVRKLESNPDIDFISCQYDFIKENGSYKSSNLINSIYYNILDLLSGNTPLKPYYIKDSKKVKYPNIFSFFQRNSLELIRSNNIGACFLYRKSIAEKVGEYDTSVFCAEDYDYWCRMSLLCNVLYDNKNLYSYRINSQSLTTTKANKVKELKQKIREKYAILYFDKYLLTDKQRIVILLNFYLEENNVQWIKIAKNINDYLYKKIKSSLRYKIKVKYRNIIAKLLVNKNNKN